MTCRLVELDPLPFESMLTILSTYLGDGLVCLPGQHADYHNFPADKHGRHRNITE